MAQRMKPFSSKTTGHYAQMMETGKVTRLLRPGKTTLYRKKPRGTVLYYPHYPKRYTQHHIFNEPLRAGAEVTRVFLPENAKKKNMRPRFELFNTTERDGARLRHTKRLAQVAIPVEKAMQDDVRLARENAEALHGLQHTPLLHRQFDPERREENAFARYDSEGRPLPAEVLPDFPRFYDAEMFAELDEWQRKTNAARHNPNTEMFICFHFWAHDDKWVYRRRLDVWDYVKSQAREYLREKLRLVQMQLYGCEKSYGTADGPTVLRTSDLTVSDAAGGQKEVSVRVSCKPRDPREAVAPGTTVRSKLGSEAEWTTHSLSAEGSVTVRKSFADFSLGDAREVLLVEAGGASARLELRPAAELPSLAVPADLERALEGWSKEEVQELYRQELMKFEEDVYNCLHNLDAMMAPTPILYALHNETFMGGTGESRDWRVAKRDFDWWFHHQSFKLYLPFYDEEFIYRLQNWRHVVNQKVGNSPWRDQLRQYAPQPVNCLLQIFRKHNSVWDSRAFRVEHEADGEYQEEAMQQWSYVEDQQEPQPSPPIGANLQAQPARVEGVEPEEVDIDTVRDGAWLQLARPTDVLRVDGAAATPAEEYWADTFAARRKHGAPLHPDDYPSVEEEPKPKFEVEPEAERKKQVRRLGKLYRKYVNPYNPNPQRFINANLRPMDRVTDLCYF